MRTPSSRKTLHVVHSTAYLNAHVKLVPRVENAVRKRRARADRKEVVLEPRAVRVDIVQVGAGLVPAGNHRAHRQAHALVLVDRVAEQLGRGGHRYALAIAQLVQAALRGQHALPVRAVGGAAGHRAQQLRVDLDDLLDGARANVRAH